MSNSKQSARNRGVAHQPASPTLELKQVSVAYVSGASSGLTIRGGQHAVERYALEDISFRVESGARVAIVGPNGAGKSTLLGLVVGTVKPSAGQVNVYGHGPAGHTCIAYVPQRSRIDWTFPVTVKDVVMMGRVAQIGLFRWPGRSDHAIVRECLEKVNALHLVQEQIGELSGGQQQRIFIARALAQEAELLLMDEPLTGLDAPSRDAIFEILDRLQSEGVTVLVATHDLKMAAARFDQIMLLNRRIVAYGPPAAVLNPESLLMAYGGGEVVESGKSARPRGSAA